MPLVRGIGDEVVYAALAAAATPLAIALSPAFLRRRSSPAVAVQSSSLSRTLRVLWSRVRLWLLRKAAQALGALQRRLPAHDATPSLSTSASSGIPAGPASMDATRDPLDACLMEDDEGSKKGNRPCHRDDPMPAGLPARPDAVHHKSRASGRGEAPPAGEYCAVCHDDYTLPCQANCGHWFCAECIMRVWHHGSALSPCRCPICRRTITLLLLCDMPAHPTPAESSSSASSTAASSGGSEAEQIGPAVALGAGRRLQLQQDVAKYNRLFGGTPVSMWQRILDMPVLLQRMGRDLVNPSRALNLLHNVRFVVCTACVGMYVVSPFDIIPEGLVGVLGFLDDIVFLLCVAFYLTVLYRALLVNRASAWPRASQAPAEGAAATFDDSSYN